ncbi:MAG: tRNA (adenosine(37)-N6)-threonylcarbamoyltransferase complex dimerization subunit type 1 TsaB [Planctomycetes bacterium]|nr:tRNA (adenosine(37)-N6)-threonylcarbamoyltransferase complex dimerization subunit type 1 TsaB [Planctomycetota bacterium]
MIALGLEASARVGSVALYRGAEGERGETVEVELCAEGGHARALAPAIQDLLASRGLAARDLDLIVVGLGPGGYTGVRLALATAKTLSIFLTKPLLGVPSTAALAAHARVPAGAVLAAVDARHGLVYGGLYHKDEHGLPREVEAPFLRPAAELLATLAPATFVAGDGCDVLRRAAGGAVNGDPALVPRAADLLALGLKRFARGQRDEERTLQPLYLRPSEAEIRFERLRREERSDRRSEPEERRKR